MPTDTEKQEFIEGFIAAEGALKKYEQESTETLVPCINELRYSAYHVVQALKAEQKGESAGNHWQRAIRHTQRAKFDVMEFNVALYMDKVEKITQSYKVTNSSQEASYRTTSSIQKHCMLLLWN